MIIQIGNEEVNLDESILEVNPDTINRILSKFAAWHNYYQNKHNDAALIARSYADQHASMLQSKFRHYKEATGCSDKMAEACAKSDDDVVELQKKVRAAEYVKDSTYGFLRSMDYAHQNTLQLAYNMRKELDKIGSSVSKMDQKLEEIFNKE